MELNPTNVQPILLNAIATTANGFDVVEDLYLRAAELEGQHGWFWDWPVIDQAVVDRFGVAGLERIKVGLAAGSGAGV